MTDPEYAEKFNPEESEATVDLLHTAEDEAKLLARHHLVQEMQEAAKDG